MVLANIVWPSLYLFFRERAGWMIVIAVLVEFVILRRSLNTTPLRAFGITLAINLFSALAGAIPIALWNSNFPYDRPMFVPPLVWLGLVWATYVDGTFSLQSWSVSVLAAALLSTLFESALLFTLFRRFAAKRCLLRLLAANLASAGLTYLSLRLVSPGVRWWLIWPGVL